MAMLRFDKELLGQQLEGLPLTHRAAFAAACAERLLPAYSRFSDEAGRGDPETIRMALSRLWEDLNGGNPASELELRALAKKCLALVPREDEEPWVDWQPSGEDAAAAVVYALEARWKEGSQEATRVARRAYEAIDRFAMKNEPGVIVTAASEARVLEHRLVQAELARQRRDLDELRGARDRDVRDLASRLRDRAVVESATFFG